MAFFRSVSLTEQLPTVVGDGVVLRPPQMSDYPEWAALREASRNFLTPWEPTWPPDDLTRASFRRRIRRYAEDQRCDLAYPFFVFRQEDNALVGGLTLANVRRGCAQTGNLGYWIGVGHARCGYITSRPPASRPMSPRSASWRRPDFGEKALRANTCASTACGRTICSLRASRAMRSRDCATRRRRLSAPTWATATSLL